MTQRVKMLSGLLALLLASSAFAACENNHNHPETSVATDTQEPVEETTEEATEETTEEITNGETESESEPETTQPHDHTYGDWTTVAEATCNTDGKEERVCACGETETRPIPADCVPDDDGVCLLCGQEVDWADFRLRPNDEGTGYDVVGYAGTDYQVTIPSAYKGLPVTGILGGAFFLNTNVVSVTIPSSVTFIVEEAFVNCPRVAEVINHSSVRINPLYALEVHRGESKIINLDDFLFYAYDGEMYLLGYAGTETDLIFPESVNGKSYKIKNNAFGMDYAHNSRLKSIVLSNGVTEIGLQAFYACTGLTSITIPGSVTEIVGQAFQRCSGLTDVTIMDGVTEIGKFTFDGCENLSSVTFENASGWTAGSMAGSVDLSEEDLSDPFVAATYFTSTYRGHKWEQK